MVGGFNTNVRYRGRMFHVQTEDSGEAHPHIITLLYEGGAILTSRKQSYGESIGQTDAGPTVRERMEAQHRAIVAGLKQGEFDDVIDARHASSEDTSPGTDAEVGQAAERQEESLPPQAPVAPAAPGRESPARFGAGVITDRPLDAVVLAHLA